MAKGSPKTSSHQKYIKIWRVIALYEGGLSMQEVGLQFGISRQRVHQILKKAKEKPEESGERSYKETRRLIELYQSGLSMKEVGTEFGISAQRVEQILKKAGVEKRKFTKSDKFLKVRKEKRKILPKELLVKYYLDENLPIPEILRRLEAGRSLLYNSLEYHKIPIRKTEGLLDSKLTEELLRRLYLDENLTAREIGQKLGFAAVTVKKRLSKFGIKKTNN